MRDFKSSLPLVIKVCGYLALALLSSLSISQEDFFSRLIDHTNLASAYADSGTTTDIMSFGNAKYNSNLVYNSSFELGMHGWAPVHPNPGINFDKEVFYHGTRALRLSSGQRIQSRFIKVSLDREYTISLFIKARHLNSQVHIGFIDGRCSGNRDRKAPNIDPQTEMGRKVSVTDQWNRYVLTKGLLTEQGQRRNGNTNHLPCHSPYYVVEIENIGPGDVWIDAVC
ncbi:MAG: carbohydrate binding domain-containing protein [Candidatus Omnitrophica bacterium]|nr:carbohydrate binding domain-containing protein [Candidatus Omnitrophota bacterium]